MWTSILLAVGVALVIVLGLAVVHVRSLFRGPDYARLPACYPFKSEAARARFHAYCDARARDYPPGAEERILTTAYGPTFVRTCGPADAPPLVLLPSASASSLIWVANVADLARHFRVHAVDNIYDVGRSVNTRPVTGAEELTEWLHELLGQLEPDRRVHLMGLSFGGWLTAEYARRHPERLAKVVLAAPAATFLPLPAAWAWRAILGVLPPRRFFMTRLLVRWMCKGLVKRNDERSRRLLRGWVDDALIAMSCFRFRMPVAPTVLSDEELRSLKPPVLFVVGEHEVVYPAEKAVARARALIPSVVTSVIADASHDLTISQTARFNDEVVSFLLGPSEEEAARA